MLCDDSADSPNEAAFAVRQIEVGLTSPFSLLFGSTLTVFGLAMLLSTRYPAWLGGIGLLGRSER